MEHKYLFKIKDKNSIIELVGFKLNRFSVIKRLAKKK